MIVLLILAYIIMGIFIANFLKVLLENKTKFVWGEDYLSVLSITALGIYWPLIVTVIPLALLYLVFQQVVKLSTWSAKEIFNPKENI